MTERGKRNIANALMIIGFFCLLYFVNFQRTAWAAAIGIVMMLFGILTQALLDFKALEGRKGSENGHSG